MYKPSSNVLSLLDFLSGDAAPTTTFEASLKYAEMGFKVIPLEAGGKRPAIGRWKAEASSNAVKLREWFYNTNYNIGILTGNGLVVIDVDAQSGGLESFKEIESEFTETLKISTPGGGFHLYYESDVPVATSHNVLGKGISVISKGAYVVAPPSIIVKKIYKAV